MVGKYHTLQQLSLNLSYLTSCATFIVKNEILPTKNASALLKLRNTEEREGDEKINHDESHDTINGTYREIELSSSRLLSNRNGKNTLVEAAQQTVWKTSLKRESARGGTKRSTLF